jgi:hypothetical protein
VAIEVTASIAASEPDPYLAQVYRFGLLEDFDHMYHYSALMDRVEGKTPIRSCKVIRTSCRADRRRSSIGIPATTSGPLLTGGRRR